MLLIQKIYEQKKIIRNLKHQLGKRFDEKEVASIVGEVEDVTNIAYIRNIKLNVT